MAARSSQTNTSEPGIIILGNAGAGKSYICNLLIGYDRFKAEFQPDAVTTETEHHRVSVGSNSFRIYNIPGLVEVNQEHIDRNKREIVKAFDQSPTSVVLFVWTQIGGRAQNDDVIAFNALNDAYKFPSESLMFVVNNIPPKRPRDYEGKFIATLSNLLKPNLVSLKNTFFLDTLDSEDKEKVTEAGSRLYLFIDQHHASLQRKHADIILQSDQLQQMRELLKKQQLEAERDRKAFENQIHQMGQQYLIAKEAADQQYQQMRAQLEETRREAEEDRWQYERERKKIEARFREEREAAEDQFERLETRLGNERRRAAQGRKILLRNLHDAEEKPRQERQTVDQPDPQKHNNNQLRDTAEKKSGFFGSVGALLDALLDTVVRK